jgi:hypothetical protein
MNPVHIVQTSFPRIHINNILPFALRASKRLLPFRLPNQNFVPILIFPCMLHVLSIASLIWAFHIFFSALFRIYKWDRQTLVTVYTHYQCEVMFHLCKRVLSQHYKYQEWQIHLHYTLFYQWFSKAGIADLFCVTGD